MSLIVLIGVLKAVGKRPLARLRKKQLDAKITI